MTALQAKRFESPDETRPFKGDKGKVDLVGVAGSMVGHGTFEPGWRWSEHVKPLSGTDSCQVEHIGYVMQGRMKVMMNDGQQLEVQPGDVFHMDVLPAIPDPDGRASGILLTDRDFHEWLHSDPIAYTNWFKAIRALFERLNDVPSVKLMLSRPSAPVATTSPR